MDRKPKLTPHQRKEALDRREAREPLVEIARTYAVFPLDDFEAEVKHGIALVPLRPGVRSTQRLALF